MRLKLGGYNKKLTIEVNFVEITHVRSQPECVQLVDYTK